MEVVDSDDLIVITDAGVLMRQPVGAIRTIGRVTQGVRLVKLDDEYNFINNKGNARSRKNRRNRNR